MKGMKMQITMIQKIGGLALALALMPAVSGAGIEPHSNNNKAHKLKPLSYFWHKHHYEVTIYNDKITKVIYRDNKTHKVLLQAFPHGREASLSGGLTKKLTVRRFRSFMKARKKRLNRQHHFFPQSTVLQANAHVESAPIVITDNTGTPLGYNPSTGWLPSSNCFNFSLPIGSKLVTNAFTSQGAASSEAGQTNVSAGVSGSYSAFQAQDNFSYSNSYDNNATSGQIYFNDSVIYTAKPNLNTSSPFSAAGTQATTAGTFSTQCGSQILTTVAVGMLITAEINYSTSSTSTSTGISNAFSGSYGLDSVTNAVNVTNKTASGSYSYGFNMTIQGGTEQAILDITTGFNNAESVMNSCFAGNTTSCTTFETDLNVAAQNANNDFIATMDPLANDASSQAVSLAIFPNGIAGVAAPVTTTEGIAAALQSTTSYDDVLGPYSKQILNYTNILNQIATLNNRVNYLTTALSTPNNCCGASYSKTMNPAPVFDISGSYLSYLGGYYSADLTLMKTNLGNCLNATSSNVTAACAPITNLYGSDGSVKIGSAYDWYTNTNQLTGSTIAPNNFAAQNTIALQYSGLVTVSGISPSGFPLDVMWVAALPQFPSMPGLPANTAPPSFDPGLIGFADVPYQWNNGLKQPFTSPYVLMMPTPGTATISAPATSYSTTGFNMAEYGSISTMGWQAGSGSKGSTYYVDECNGNTNAYPTFSNPCAISTSYPYPTNPTVSATLNQINNFFGN